MSLLTILLKWSMRCLSVASMVLILLAVSMELFSRFLKWKYLKKRKIKSLTERGKYFQDESIPREGSDCFDVVVVGAGPAGSSCAYFAARAGLKVAMLERKKFPRDKYCGDAVCVPALKILEEMDLIKTLEERKQIFYPDNGGFVSPGGLSYIGKSVAEVGRPLCGAVKRIILDEEMAKCAARTGATLIEEFEVDGVAFDEKVGMWSLTASDNQKKVKGRVLVCSDGSASTTARKIGYVTAAPRGVSSRAFIKGGTHNAKMDAIIVYPPFSLPGYCAVFKHVEDELNFCYYLIPCGKNSLGDVDESDLPSLHNYALKKDPFVSRLLGPKAEIETMRVAPLRVGLEGVKSSYGDHVLLAGDAAGFVDPITGEGIHSAMMSGKDAALTLIDSFRVGDFSSKALRQYEHRWMNSFGGDFRLSQGAAWLLWKFPIILDGCAEAMQMQGNELFAEWAKVMTMYGEKDLLLRWTVLIPISFSILRSAFRQYILGIFIGGMRLKYPGQWSKGV